MKFCNLIIVKVFNFLEGYLDRQTNKCKYSQCSVVKLFRYAHEHCNGLSALSIETHFVGGRNITIKAKQFTCHPDERLLQSFSPFDCHTASAASSQFPSTQLNMENLVPNDYMTLKFSVGKRPFFGLIWSPRNPPMNIHNAKWYG